jgi:importin subunit alpha-1
VNCFEIESSTAISLREIEEALDQVQVEKTARATLQPREHDTESFDASRNRGATYRTHVQLNPDKFRSKRSEALVNQRRARYDEMMSARRRSPKRETSPKSKTESATVATQLVDQLRDAVPAYVSCFASGIPDLSDPQVQVVLDLVSKLRRILSVERAAPIEEVVCAGAVPVLLSLFPLAMLQVQFEASWALTNITSGSSEIARTVIECGAIPALVQHLSANEELAEQAVWALGNLAGDGPAVRDFVIVSALNAILRVKFQKLSGLRNFTWTLSNLCRGKPMPPIEALRLILPILVKMIYSTDDEIMTDAAWAISYISDNTSYVQDVVESGVTRRLVELLMSPSFSVQTPALRCVGNIVTGDDLQTQIVLNLSVLPFFLCLLASPKKAIRKETLWAISNITAGNRHQIQAVIDANLIPPIVQLCQHSEFDIKREATWALGNAITNGDQNQIKYIFEMGVIPVFAGLLSCTDTRILTVVLEALQSLLKIENAVGMFEACGGMEPLENLQNHANTQISEMAVCITETVFGNVDEAAVNVAPADSMPTTYPFQF